MTTLAPVSVALKFGFLAVLYLFLLWVARSAMRDLRGARATPLQLSGAGDAVATPDATGLYAASATSLANLTERAPRLVVERAPGHEPGMIYDLDGDIVLGRGIGRRSAWRIPSPPPSTRAWQSAEA